MDLTDEIYDLTRCLPKEEKYGLADQMRRADVSIPSNIAEGHGRQTNRDFKRFLLISMGSVAELETQLFICIRQKYVTKEQVNTALRLCNEVGKMLTAFINHLSSSSANMQLKAKD